jgi:hypothetical protein
MRQSMTSHESRGKKRSGTTEPLPLTAKEKKGIAVKQGVPMEIPTAAATFWAKERKKAAKKRRKAAAKAEAARSRPATIPAPLPPIRLSPVRIAGEKIEAARKELAAAAEHLATVGSFVAPILEREGYKPDQTVPGSLTTKLLLEGREIDARLVTRLITARAEWARLRSREGLCRAEYARAKADEAAMPKPPWL